ncbi:Uncharacterised protein [Mycobacteroides abscessus subsp. abscessus]|nr:Uncharacterised protein [Mycobacteroides abscessus subsp. abscessus]
MLAETGEGEIVVPQRASGTDLRGLLPEQRGPEREFALTLQGRGLVVDAADHHHVLVQSPQLSQAVLVEDVADQRHVLGILDPVAVRIEELDGLHNLPSLTMGRTACT